MNVESEYRSVAEQRVARLVQEARRSSGWYNAWILLRREIMRFVGIIGQAVLSPVISTMLYFLVFGVSLGARLDTVSGIPYMDFLTPGLVVMALISNSFINASFSFYLSKIHGTIVDLLVAPMTNLQIICAYSVASVVRGVLTGGIIWAIAGAFGASVGKDPWMTLGFMALVSCVFSLLGLAVAVVSKEFEHVNFVPAFVMGPLTFLGGVFYSVGMLPGVWGKVALWNPFLYMVNGIRLGMTGVSDVSLESSIAVSVGGLLLAFALAALALRWGKNLRS